MTHTPPDISERIWSPDSWRSFEAVQQPHYADAAALTKVESVLSKSPPLVTPWEVDRLRLKIADAAAGNLFLLQGGDCAERFDECTPTFIANRLKVLLQMSLVLIYGLHTPVVRVGRFAGQYAKPRSTDMEGRNGSSLPSYRGDIINGPGFTLEDRTPDPRRMLDAYHYSTATLNYVRALGEGGFADLHHPEYWDLGFVANESLRSEYQEIVDSISDAVRFMGAIAPNKISEVERVAFFTSHEALLLPYEEALTRTNDLSERTYNLSTHFPWIGMRSASLEGAHVEYMRGIANPISIKIGPSTSGSELKSLLTHLDPDEIPGRITLTTRFGASEIERHLPPLIDAVRSTGRTVLWCSDPMHGNTITLKNGVKTRRFDDILGEMETAFDVHAAHRSVLGGVHLELTGENVTECTGGASGLQDEDLSRAYRSQVDPRLNGEQGLEMAFSILRKRRRMLS